MMLQKASKMDNLDLALLIFTLLKGNSVGAAEKLFITLFMTQSLIIQDILNRFRPFPLPRTAASMV
jgi:hypothetical protein